MIKDAVVGKDISFYSNAIKRWHDNITPGEEYESNILRLQKEYRKYYPNVYVLNKKALIIQHFYFNLRSKWLRGGIVRTSHPLNSSQIFFKPKYSLNNSKLYLNGSKQTLKPPKWSK